MPLRKKAGHEWYRWGPQGASTTFSCFLPISSGFDIRWNIVRFDEVWWWMPVCSFSYFAYIFICLKYLVVKLLKRLLFPSRVTGKGKVSSPLPLPLLYLPRPQTHTRVIVSAKSGVGRRGGALRQRKIPSGHCVLIYSCGWTQSI